MQNVHIPGEGIQSGTPAAVVQRNRTSLSVYCYYSINKRPVLNTCISQVCSALIFHGLALLCVSLPWNTQTHSVRIVSGDAVVWLVLRQYCFLPIPYRISVVPVRLPYLRWLFWSWLFVCCILRPFPLCPTRSPLLPYYSWPTLNCQNKTLGLYTVHTVGHLVGNMNACLGSSLV